MADQGEGRRRRRRARSTLMAWIFLAVAAGLLGLFMLQASEFTEFTAEKIDAPTKADAAPPKQSATVTGSAVSGFDKDNLPYSITAATAVQDDKNSSLVVMDDVSGTLRKPDGRELGLSAKEGRFNVKTKALDLSGDVALTLQSRFRATMDKAEVGVEDRTLSSDAGVHVTFEGGEIRSEGIDITDSGSRVLFRNGVKASFSATDEAKSSKDNLQQ